METTKGSTRIISRLYLVYIGIIEKRMETTIVFRVQGFECFSTSGSPCNRKIPSGPSHRDDEKPLETGTCNPKYLQLEDNSKSEVISTTKLSAMRNKAETFPPKKQVAVDCWVS